MDSQKLFTTKSIIPLSMLLCSTAAIFTHTPHQKSCTAHQDAPACGHLLESHFQENFAKFFAHFEERVKPARTRVLEKAAGKSCTWCIHTCIYAHFEKTVKPACITTVFQTFSSWLWHAHVYIQGMGRRVYLSHSIEVVGLELGSLPWTILQHLLGDVCCGLGTCFAVLCPLRHLVCLVVCRCNKLQNACYCAWSWLHAELPVRMSILRKLLRVECVVRYSELRTLL